MSKAPAILFTVLYVVMAYLMAAVGSVHGPDLLAYFVAGYLLIAIAALWWAYFFLCRPEVKHKTFRFVLYGVAISAALVAASFASWRPLVNLDVRRMQERAAATEVFNMHDELLVSAKGNPIGIRLQYSMRFPDSNYYWQSPSVMADPDLGIGTFWSSMQIAKQTIDPPMSGSDPLKYERGKTYNFVVDMLPYFVHENADRTKFCIMKTPTEYADAFNKFDEAVRYRISVSGTNCTATTTNSYNPKQFFNTAAKEAAFECKEFQSKYF